MDLGIKHQDIKLIWLILLGELMIVIGRTSTDFIRRWLLLHISMRINISLVSDFFIKLLKLPMSFFDTKLMGDLLQRMGDHSRVQSFLTNQTLGVMFTTLSFLIFGVILAYYNLSIFTVFLAGSALYGIWIATSTRTRPTSSSPRCRKSSCRTASNAGVGNGKTCRRTSSGCR